MSAQPHANARPFLFDTVFEGGQVITPPRAKRAYTPEEVEAVRADAYADGQASAVARAETAAAATLAQIQTLAGEALSALARIAHDHRTAAADLALAAARKIAGAALDRFPEAPAAAALTALAQDLEATPRLIVHVAAADEPRLARALEQAATAAGFAGQIVLKPSPVLNTAAFVFDWGDGRAAFDPDAASARVQAALDAALAADGLHAEPLIPSPPPRMPRDE